MDFVTRFHNLEGQTLGQRKKNLYKLLLEIKTSTNEDEFISLLKDLPSKTFQQRYFIVHILIYYRRTTELLQIFKEGNNVFVSKIMSQNWFIKDAFTSVSSGEFVNNFVPQLSYSTRVKLFKRLGQVLDEKRLDEIFDRIQERYGIYAAKVILPSCSVQKIDNTFKTSRILFSISQTKQIFNKNPNLLLSYISHCKENSIENPIYDKTVLVYIAQKNPNFFWKLVEEFKFNVSLGRRTTKRVLPEKKNDVITLPSVYVKFFKYDKLVRMLNEQEFKKLFTNMFPRDKETVRILNKRSNNFRLLKYYPKKKQFELYSEIYGEIFGESVWTNKFAANEYFLSVVEDENIRKQIAGLKYEITNDFRYVVYYPVEESLKLLREKIKVTSAINDRTKIITYLVETCRINKDLRALSDVLKYFCYRHRNEQKYTRSSFLNAVIENFGNRLNDFDETHWKYINEIFKIMKINGEVDWNFDKLKIKYLEFLYNNKKSLKETLKDFLEEKDYTHRSNNFSLDFSSNPEFTKQFLQIALEIASNEDENKLFLLVGKVVLTFNMKYPEFSIYLLDNPKLIEIIRKNDDKVEDVWSIISASICKLDRNDVENELVDVFFRKSFETYYSDNKKVVTWFLRNEPSKILNYSDILSTYFIDVDRNILDWYQIKFYSHLHLDTSFLERFKTELNKDKNYPNKLIVSSPLSILLTTEEYVNIAESFLPSNFKLDVEQEQDTMEYKARCKYAENLKNVIENQLCALNLAMKFSTGDYLSSTLSSLYSLFCKTPEYMLYQQLDCFKNKADSARKHLYFLCSYVLTQEDVKKYFDPSREENLRLVKYMLRSSLKYLVRNPSDEAFVRVAYFLDNIVEEDTESWKMLPGVKISKKYRGLFVQKVWSVCEKIKKENPSTNIETSQFQLLDMVKKERVLELSQEFCKEIIDTYFLRNKSMSIMNLICDYLLYRVQENDENLQYVFERICRFKSGGIELGSRKIINIFFNQFETKLKHMSNIDGDLFLKFTKKWNSVFTPIEMFDEFISLKLFQIKLECGENFEETLPSKLIQFYLQILNELGLLVFQALANDIERFLDFLDARSSIKLYLKMLEISQSNDLVCLLILQLVSGNLWLNLNELKDDEKKLLEVLGNVESEIVKLRFNLYIKNNT